MEVALYGNAASTGRFPPANRRVWREKIIIFLMIIIIYQTLPLRVTAISKALNTDTRRANEESEWRNGEWGNEDDLE